MTKLTISMPDELAEAIRASAGGNVSDYIARAVRQQLLADDLRKLAAFEQAEPKASLADEFPQGFEE
ncbi:hypothetical protein [Nocardia sp. NPDC052566]|uniref:hypothetical protein n=1 Tax=Nocardia sp. NPDC052566 TaxID=3364330 RepID=UPI0037C5AAF4